MQGEWVQCSVLKTASVSWRSVLVGFKLPKYLIINFWKFLPVFCASPSGCDYRRENFFVVWNPSSTNVIQCLQNNHNVLSRQHWYVHVENLVNVDYWFVKAEKLKTLIDDELRRQSDLFIQHQAELAKLKEKVAIKIKVHFFLLTLSCVVAPVSCLRVLCCKQQICSKKTIELKKNSEKN